MTIAIRFLERPGADDSVKMEVPDPLTAISY